MLLLALAAPVHGQSFGFPWWKDAQFQRDLSLTSRPVHPNRQRLPIDDHPPAAKEGGAGPAGGGAVAPDRGERRRSGRSRGRWTRSKAIRANLNKTRTLMLLRMRQVLTPDQRVQAEQASRTSDRTRRRDGEPRRNRRVHGSPAMERLAMTRNRIDLDAHGRVRARWRSAASRRRRTRSRSPKRGFAS